MELINPVVFLTRPVLKKFLDFGKNLRMKMIKL